MIDSQHADYAAHVAEWLRCKHCIAGQDSVKAQETEYLPMLTGQTTSGATTAYSSYLKRATYFNAVGRTVDALTGTINAKPPVVVMPDALTELVRDITLSGVTLEEFVNELLENVIGLGRVGVLVDFPSVDTTSVTLAEAAAKNLRPYARVYEALNITNWRTASVNGKEQLTMVVLSEWYGTMEDEFTEVMAQQYRVLDLTANGYRQRVFRQQQRGGIAKGIAAKGIAWTLFSSNVPVKNGEPLTSIPFRFINVDCAGAGVDTPPLLDLVDTNLAHYRNSADYEHGLHFTGLPQPYVSGAQKPESGAVYVGSAEILFLSDPSAKFGYGEFMGQGMKPLADAIAAKERRMAVLGARMLMDEKKAAEAVAAIEIRFGGENSVLASIARSASLGIVWMLETLADWGGIAGEINYELNMDYNPSKMEHSMLTALVAAWQAGGIQTESYVDFLMSGDVLPAATDVKAYAAELDRLKEKAQAAAGAGTGTQDPLLTSLRGKMGL